jgi:hypothetical protein
MRIRKIVRILVNRFCFFRFLPQGSAIWLNVPKRVFFRRFDKRFFLWKCKKRHFRNVTSPKSGEHRIGRTFLNFRLIGCKSSKKCAKSTIVNTKVRIRNFKCHQKIPWVRFAGNDISNYGLILITNCARAQTVPKESFGGIYFLILTFIFKIVDSRTFLSIYSQSGGNSKKYDQFDVNHLLGLLYSENGVFCISTEKNSYQNVEKHPFLAHSTRLLTPEAKIENNRTDLLKFRQFSGFSQNFKTFRCKL